MLEYIMGYERRVIECNEADKELRKTPSPKGTCGRSNDTSEGEVFMMLGKPHYIPAAAQ